MVWKNFFILPGPRRGSMGFFCTTAVALRVPASYVQMNWFRLRVISQFFTWHNSYSGSHSGCTFWTKLLNPVRWGWSQVGVVSDCITSLQSAYCDCCPICKPDWQSQGHIAGWGDLMLSCTSGRPSSGFRACTWGSRHSWCWRRDTIPQCKWESLYWPSDIACSTLQHIWDYWQVSCLCILNRYYMLSLGHGESYNAPDSFESSFQCCLGPSVALRCSLSIWMSGAPLLRCLHCHYQLQRLFQFQGVFSGCMMLRRVCVFIHVFSYMVKMKHLPVVVGIVSVPDIPLSPSHSVFSICVWDDFFLCLLSASFRRSSSHFCFL